MPRGGRSTPGGREVTALRDVNRRVLAVVLIGVACAAFLGTGGPAERQMIDHHVNVRTVAEIRAGASYYPAMDDALREAYGPSETVRAFRMPTLFWLWSLLPNDFLVWTAFVAAAGGAGLLTMRLTRFPLLGPLLTLLLLATGRLREASGWVDQWTTVELWGAGLVAAVAVLWQRGRYAGAAAVALAAVLVRETTGGLLVGGLVGAWLLRRHRPAWTAAVVVAAGLYLLHAHEVTPWLVGRGEGAETPLLGTGGWRSPLAMMGFGLPLGSVVGPPLWCAAVWEARRRRHWPVLVHLMLPACGLLLDRPYWGALTLPLVLAFGADGLGDLARAARRRLVGRLPADADVAAPEPDLALGR
jgi:hypothetical protein